MDRKNIKFYKYSIDIQDDKDFSSLKDIKNNEKPNVDSGTKVSLFNGEFFCARFYGMNIQLGDSDDYGEKVVNIKKNLEIEDNPKKKTQIELSGKSFLLIDKDNKTIYLSNSNHRELVENRLSEATKHTVSIKQILDEEKFQTSLNTISKLNFTFKNLDLFNRSDLNIALNKDLLNYEADYIKITFQYKHKSISKDLREKIKSMLTNNNKKKYRDLEIVGRNKDGIESIFKSDAILSSVKLTIQKSHYNDNHILDELIKEIKDIEKDEQSQ